MKNRKVSLEYLQSSMTPEYTNQVTVGLLLLSLFLVVTIGGLLSFVAIRYVKKGALRNLMAHQHDQSEFAPPGRYRPTIFENACRWLVVRSSNASAVQAALGLHNPMPCSWNEGMSRLIEHKLFISPPVHGWILVIGQGLPDPCEDADKCFHFLTKLSRALGQVQFFHANRVVNHHAWVRADGGRIRRAYAWTGETVWNQGELTLAEKDLGLKCFDYGERPNAVDLSAADSHFSNSDKVIFLAARWSFDPTAVDEKMMRVSLGVAGELIHSKQH